MKIEELHRFEDVHTHVKAGSASICSLHPKDAIALFRTKENQPYSIELHPWQASPQLLEEFLEACEICKEDPRFIAIGECGLDKLCDTPLELQKGCFREALSVAKKLQKPMIIHVVRLWSEMQEMVNCFGDKKLSPVIIHGFRKNATFARQLVSHGYFISLGKQFNVNVLKEISSDHIFCESDKTM